MWRLGLRVTPNFYHVSSHTSVHWNDYVDGLAKLGASGTASTHISLEAPAEIEHLGDRSEHDIVCNELGAQNPLPWIAFCTAVAKLNKSSGAN
eukprot:10587917-Karenia_brevis.AAC.1